MKNILINIAVSALVATIASFCFIQYVPLSWFHGSTKPLFGSTAITTIQGTDTISGSRTTINNNFSSLNTNKVEISDLAGTTSLRQLISTAALATIGTITTGIWHGTAVGAQWGGTGSTTLSSNQVLLGNGTGNIGIVSGWGTSGQSLVSNGGVLAPTWQSISFDQTGTYVNTGVWTFATSTTYNANFGRLVATSSIASFIQFASTTAITVSGTASTTNLIVSGTCTKASGVGCNQVTTVSTSTASANTGNNATTQVSANCSGSQVVTGGGGTYSGGQPIYLISSYPATSQLWIAVYQAGNAGGGTGGTVGAYAVCINP